MSGRCLACKRLMPLAEFWGHQSAHDLTDWTARWDGVRVLWRPVEVEGGDLRAVTIHPLICSKEDMPR